MDCRFLQIISAAHAQGSADVLLGRDVAAPPLPAAACLRVNLLDFCCSLDATLASDAGSSCTEMSGGAADASDQMAVSPVPSSLGVTFAELSEAYFDLTDAHHAHLETPAWVIQASAAASPQPQPAAGQTLSPLAGALDSITAGTPFLRSLPADRTGVAKLRADQLRDTASNSGGFDIELQPSVLRGGCTFVLHPELLHLPQDAWHGRRSGDRNGQPDECKQFK